MAAIRKAEAGLFDQSACW